MKKILFIFLLILGLSSCDNYPYEPSVQNAHSISYQDTLSTIGNNYFDMVQHLTYQNHQYILFIHKNIYMGVTSCAITHDPDCQYCQETLTNLKINQKKH